MKSSELLSLTQGKEAILVGLSTNYKVTITHLQKCNLGSIVVIYSAGYTSVFQKLTDKDWKLLS